jgi:hypothetical protein
MEKPLANQEKIQRLESEEFNLSGHSLVIPAGYD